jgi:hypothetical protein
MLPLLLLALAFARAPAANQTDPLAILSYYDGTWRTEVQHFDTAYSKAGRDSRTIENSCWRREAVYTCSQTVNGQQKALLVFTWQAADQAYDSYAVPLDGGAAGKGRLLITGDDWIYPWEQTLPSGTVHFRVVNHFRGRNHIDYRREFSSDGEHWTVMESGIEDKVGSRR